MSANAIVASGRGTVTPWIAAVVAALGYDVVATTVADRPEDGQYHLPPGVVERVGETIGGTDVSMLVVDGQLHVGQLADLQERFPDIEIHDRPSVVWEQLAASNPVADGRLALRHARVERRLAERTQRERQQQSPDGTSGRVAALDRHCDRLRDRLSDRQEAARNRVTTAHTDADAYVATVCEIGAQSRVHREQLLDQCPSPSSTASASPARAETDIVTIGTHVVAATDVPAVPWTAHVPDWFEAVVPGAIAALERADFVVCSNGRALAELLATRFDVEPVIVEQADGETVRTALASRLATAEVAVSFPYSDAAHAAVSWLHDRGDVTDLTYEERIDLSVTVPNGAVSATERRIRDAGGRLDRLSTQDGSAND